LCDSLTTDAVRGITPAEDEAAARNAQVCHRHEFVVGAQHHDNLSLLHPELVQPQAEPLHPLQELRWRQ